MQVVKIWARAVPEVHAAVVRADGDSPHSSDFTPPAFDPLSLPAEKPRSSNGGNSGRVVHRHQRHCGRPNWVRYVILVVLTVLTVIVVVLALGRG